MAGTPIIGANLNGRPRRLDQNLALIEKSNTTWVRAFLDIREKIAGGTRPEADPDVVALRHAARKQNCRLIVSLKWDFKASWGGKPTINVPSPGSSHELELRQGARQYLKGIGAPIDIVVLGNEPLWETPVRDLKGGGPPIVRFMRNVKDHLVKHGDHGDPTYLLGAFNRINSAYIRARQFPEFHREMFELARDDEDIDGIDLHLHYDEFTEAEGMVAAAREAVPNGIITVTEFSPVWRYNRYKDVPIDEFEAGEQFGLNYNLPPGTTTVDYVEYAKEHPRPPEEVGDFYDAMPWYNVNHVDDMYALFSDYDVSIGTLGFLQRLGMRNEDWTESWTPFHINFLYQPALMQTNHGIETTAHPHYIGDYRERTARGGPPSA